MGNVKVAGTAEGQRSVPRGETEREFIALASAWARHATAEQRARASRFLGALAAEPESAECAADARARGERERAFEESQLCGLELERRIAEPA
jgi:hypothetical protein